MVSDNGELSIQSKLVYLTFSCVRENLLIRFSEYLVFNEAREIFFEFCLPSMLPDQHSHVFIAR